MRGRLCSWVLVLCLLPVATGTAEDIPPPTRPLAPGAPIIDFSYDDIPTGTVRSLAELGQDEPVVLVFIQTACRSCVRELVSLKRLHEEVGGFEVLGVFLDMRQRDFKGYIADYELPFSFTWDPAYAVAEAYGVSLTPATFVIGPDRRVAAFHGGFNLSLEPQLRRELESFAPVR